MCVGMDEKIRQKLVCLVKTISMFGEDKVFCNLMNHNALYGVKNVYKFLQPFAKKRLYIKDISD